MVLVTSSSRYVTSASRYQSRSSMYIRGLIPWNSTELAESVPIDVGMCLQGDSYQPAHLRILIRTFDVRSMGSQRSKMSNLFFRKLRLLSTVWWADVFESLIYLHVNLSVKYISVGAQWLSGRVLDSTTDGPRVRASPASLGCVLEQEH